MPRVLRSIPAALAALLLAAHFYRGSAWGAASVCVVAAALSFVRRPLVAAAVRVGLACGSAVWIVTAWRIAQGRIATGTPYLRMVVIMSVVAAFTVLAACVLPEAK